MSDFPADTALTALEKGILLRICKGERKEDIGVAIGKSSHTVHSHSIRIMQKTRTHSMGMALGVAVGRGEVEIAVEQPNELSKRKRNILLGIVKGQDVRRIAIDLEVSEHTIRRDIIEMYRTLGAVSRSRANLVYIGFTTGNLAINRRNKTE